MREFVIKDWKDHPRKAAVVQVAEASIASSPPVQPSPSAPASSRASSPATPRPRPARRRPDKTAFIVAYDGEFVGFFEADGDVTPRQAYIRIAQDIAGSREDFDPALLTLWKPVLLKSARPPKGLDLVRMKITRFSREESPAPA